MSLVYFPKAEILPKKTVEEDWPARMLFDKETWVLRMWRARATLRNDQPAVTDFLEEAILQGNIHWVMARTDSP